MITLVLMTKRKTVGWTKTRTPLEKTVVAKVGLDSHKRKKNLDRNKVSTSLTAFITKC